MMPSSSSLQPPQNVAVVLEISGGTFNDGFSVTLTILEDGKTIQEDDDLPDLPAALEIPHLYQQWQNISLENSRQLQAVPGQVTNVALEDWRQRTKELENYCKTWFQNQEFKSLRDCIRANIRVRSDQSVPIIIRCQTRNQQENNILRRLPWHIWNLFTELPNAEFALFTKFHPQVATLNAQVKVLAIFGSSQGGLQLEQDRKALALLEQRGAKITWTLEPTEEELSHLLFDKVWDILFFAGHSSSQTTSGQIQISQGRFLPLDALHQSLRKAVKKGLKLAIFNSCDGLGIADFLAELKVPAVIVMREPVPDRIAGIFLLEFLQVFSQRTPLCKAVREARNRLEILQGKFPAATWLPVVCINPSQPELVWPAQSWRYYLRQLLVWTSPLLLSRWRSYLPPHDIVTRFTAFALAVIITVTLPLLHSPNSKQPYIEPTFISYGKKPITDSIVTLSEGYRTFRTLKNEGIKAFNQGQYANAVRIFQQLPTKVTKDPEILIYRNNAEVNFRHQQNPNSPIYTIAAAAPLNLNAGLDILFGVAQAQDVAVNEKKINLQVVIANDLNQPDQSRKIAEKLSQDKKILAVVGHYTSSNTCAALKVYSPNQLVVISPTSTVVNLQSNQNCNDPNRVFYRTVSSTRVEAHSLVQYLVDVLRKNQPKVVVFYNRQEWFSKDLSEQFVEVLKAFNGAIIASFDLSDSNFDTRNLPPEVKNADALVVLPDGGTKDETALQKAIDIIKLNKGEKPILGANTLYLQKVIKDAEVTTVANRLFMAVDWHPKQCGAAKFAQQIKDYWGGDLNRRTALAYEAVQAILQAIKLSGTSVNSADIRQKLSETGIRPNMAVSSDIIKGLTISFDAKGDRIEFTTGNITNTEMLKQTIVTVKTVNKKLSFELAENFSCPQK
ncbi:extracellular ligand-binding receptor [Calothrix sp. NIES-2100]|uniref:ABC transporter substrate-binding protein n=1 Tax=Calothrix sp. NIES-2100 TaxID=1954172 RepID=UPI000B622859|nr:extracellular ligand-binding receptor [Calothrix sp. NIES-2100]